MTVSPVSASGTASDSRGTVMVFAVLTPGTRESRRAISQRPVANTAAGELITGALVWASRDCAPTSAAGARSASLMALTTSWWRGSGVRES